MSETFNNVPVPHEAEQASDEHSTTWRGTVKRLMKECVEVVKRLNREPTWEEIAASSIVFDPDQPTYMLLDRETVESARKTFSQGAEKSHRKEVTAADLTNFDRIL